MLAKLLKSFDAPEGPEALRAWLLEQGMPQHVVAAVSHGLLYGVLEEAVDLFHRNRPANAAGTAAYAINPFAFFDTCKVGVAGSEATFFRDLIDKPDAMTNCYLPCRLQSGSSMLIKRVSVAGADGLEGVLSVRINNTTPLQVPLGDLHRMGAMGFPMEATVADNDDIRVKVQLSGTDSPVRPVRVTLHGWLRQGLGV